MRRLVLLLLLVLVGCSGEPAPESGLVVDRQHDPHEYDDEVCDGGYVYGYNWRTGDIDFHYDSCADTDRVHVNDPDTWHIELQDCRETDHDPMDVARYSDCHRGWQDVSQEVHDELRVGDWYGEGRPPSGDR